MASQFLHLLCDLDKSCDRVDWTGGIADCALRMLPDSGDGLNAGLQVSDIVQRIEYPEHVYAVQPRFLDEPVDSRVIEAAICDQVLSAQKHQQLGLGQQLPI